MTHDPHLNTARALALILLTVSLGGTLEAGEPARVQEPQDDPLPFDPLSPAEQRQAIETALRDDALTTLIGDRYEVIGASLYTHKSLQDLEEWPRLAETWVYDHGSALTVRALVDLDAGEVVLVHAVAVQPPLTAGEVDGAGRLALGDEWVRDRLAGAAVDPDQVTWTGRLWEGDSPTACSGQRCVLVAFMQEGGFLNEHIVLVDLTDQQVRGILSNDHSLTHAETDLPREVRT